MKKQELNHTRNKLAWPIFGTIALLVAAFAASVLLRTLIHIQYPDSTHTPVFRVAVGSKPGQLHQFSYPSLVLRSNESGLAAADVSDDGTIYVADRAGQLFVQPNASTPRLFPASPLHRTRYLRWIGAGAVVVADDMDPEHFTTLTFSDQKLRMSRFSTGVKNSLSSANDAKQQTGAVQPLSPNAQVFGLGGAKGHVWQLLEFSMPSFESLSATGLLAFDIVQAPKRTRSYNIFDVPKARRGQLIQYRDEFAMTVSRLDGHLISSRWAGVDKDGWERYIQLDNWKYPARYTSTLVDLTRLGRVTTAIPMAADANGNIYLQYNYATRPFAKSISENTEQKPLHRGRFLAIAVVRPGSTVAEPLFDTYSQYVGEIQTNWSNLSHQPNNFGTGHVIGVDSAGCVYLEVFTGKEYRIDKISFPPQPPKPWWRVW
ncbi:MAG TPA: hypothetical protein VGK19_24460 [Capsulimonadaceae bacterium]|jgi:hypothetical protein